MAYFTGKNDFASGNQITHTVLNQITDNLRLSADSITSSFSLSGGQLSLSGLSITSSLIADDAIITAKLPNSTSTTDGVTYAKIQFVSSSAKVLGRKSSGSGVIEELTIDTLLTDVSTNDDTVASAKAIGAMYGSNNAIVPAAVGATTDYSRLPNGLIFKMGTVSAAAATSTTITFDSTLAFTTIYSIQVTAEQDTTAQAASVKTIAGDRTTFDASHANGVTNLHYLAIGR